MKQALLIYNPVAGGWRNSARRARRLARRLAGAYEVAIEQTHAPGHAEELARAAAGSVDAVFAYGGDGTLRECASGLLGSETSLGFLPGGTANVMTRVLGLPQSAARAADLLAHGHSVPLDIGLCGERPLLMQASAGLDSQVLARLDPKRKRLLGKFEVAINLVPAWWSFPFPQFDVHWANQHRSVTFAALCNISFYGGPWRIAPDARADDGALHLVMFFGQGRQATLGFARDLLFNRHQGRGDVEIVRVQEAEISAAEGLALQIDGDAIPDALPAHVRVATERVRVLVPSAKPS